MKQYEVITLVIIWQVFKDIALLPSVNLAELQREILVQMSVNIGGGLLMFALLGIFVFLNRKSKAEIDLLRNPQKKQLIYIKKLLVLVLLISLIALIAFYGSMWIYGAFNGVPLNLYELQFELLGQVFTLMIFVDIILALIYYTNSEKYRYVFRDVAFIISTIFIRFSINSNFPVEIVLALTSLLIGNFASLIFNYYKYLFKGSSL